MSIPFFIFCCLVFGNYISENSGEMDKAEPLKSKKLENSKRQERNVTKGGKSLIPQFNNELCFPVIGCIKTGFPWMTNFATAIEPQSPEEIQTKVYLYSRWSAKTGETIQLYPEISLGQSHFDPSKITVFIVHGFCSTGSETWLHRLKNAYLKRFDANVMIVDWGRGANQLNYLQVAANTLVVGKQLGLLVKQLINNFGAEPGQFHLIGHSLGAHICSFIGKEVRGIARLTALDPAQPGFEGFDKEVRLDKTDAEFVDVIHTDARPFNPTLGFGIIAPHGHVDYYMNGGFFQPGCGKPVSDAISTIKSISSLSDLGKISVESIAKVVSCSHGKAYEYFIEAYEGNCTIWGQKTKLETIVSMFMNTVTQGFFLDVISLLEVCSVSTCSPIGPDTLTSPLRGVFLAVTNNREPYCMTQYASMWQEGVKMFKSFLG